MVDRGFMGHLQCELDVVYDLYMNKVFDFLITAVFSATHQHGWCLEEVTEGVVEKVEEGCGIQISISHHLAGEERLAGT